MLKVSTHDGKFHPDEIFACVLLNWMVKESKPYFARTRKPERIEKYKNDPEFYVIDVGGEYDESKLVFDHHHSTFDVKGENGDLLSSCGLIWKYLLKNEKFLKDNNVTDFIKEKVTEFTIMVDRHDNGVEYAPELEFVSLFNFSKSYNKFFNAYKSAEAYFENKLALWRHLEEMSLLEDNALNEASNGIIFCDERISVNEKLNASDNKLLVCKRNDAEYSITSLNQGTEVDFTVRCPAPIEWAGKFDDSIKEYDESLVFSHKNRFMTIVKGDKNDAMRIANIIINAQG